MKSLEKHREAQLVATENVIKLKTCKSHVKNESAKKQDARASCFWVTLGAGLGQLTAVLNQNVVILGTFWGHFLVIFGVIFWTTFWSLFGPLLGAILGLMALV